MQGRINKDANGYMLDIKRLIRSIQRLEGNPDCFGTAAGACDRTDCLWREYCLKETQTSADGGFKYALKKNKQQSIQKEGGRT